MFHGGSHCHLWGNHLGQASERLLADQDWKAPHCSMKVTGWVVQCWCISILPPETMASSLFLWPGNCHCWSVLTVAIHQPGTALLPWAPLPSPTPTATWPPTTGKKLCLPHLPMKNSLTILWKITPESQFRETRLWLWLPHSVSVAEK